MDDLFVASDAFHANSCSDVVNNSNNQLQKKSSGGVSAAECLRSPVA